MTSTLERSIVRVWLGWRFFSLYRLFLAGSVFHRGAASLSFIGIFFARWIFLKKPNICNFEYCVIKSLKCGTNNAKYYIEEGSTAGLSTADSVSNT